MTKYMFKTARFLSQYLRNILFFNTFVPNKDTETTKTTIQDNEKAITYIRYDPCSSRRSTGRNEEDKDQRQPYLQGMVCRSGGRGARRSLLDFPYLLG